MDTLKRLAQAVGSRSSRDRAPGNSTRPDATGGARSAAGPPTESFADATERLLRQPIFVLAPIRSGSTLLRLLLDGHSRLYAPHELHFRRLQVKPTTKLAANAMQELGHDVTDLEHLLWDRVMHRALMQSGKAHIVEKTPANVFIWQRISECWPDARFIFLLRHPMSIVSSWHESDPEKRSQDEAISQVLKYLDALEEARSNLEGHTVRYEDLTEDPATTLRATCDHLGIAWEPGMLDYGERRVGKLRRGLGDWRGKIRSGVIQAGRELPTADEVPPALEPICRRWGYIPDEAAKPN